MQNYIKLCIKQGKLYIFIVRGRRAMRNDDQSNLVKVLQRRQIVKLTSLP